MPIRSLYGVPRLTSLSCPLLNPVSSRISWYANASNDLLSSSRPVTADHRVGLVETVGDLFSSRILLRHLITHVTVLCLILIQIPIHQQFWRI